MDKNRLIIDEIISFAMNQLAASNLTIGQVTDNKDIYDVSLTLKKTNIHQYSPTNLSFSYAHEAGFFMDIDGITWEFGEDIAVFKNESRKYIKAIRDNKVRVKPRKSFLPKFITSGNDVYIIDNDE